jgi:YaiO family outer membrane protein
MSSVRTTLLACLLTISWGSAAAAQRPSGETVLKDARAAANSGRRDEALAMLEARVAAAPRDVDARLLYGLVLSWAGRYDDARRELEQVLRQAPTYTDARVALANVEWWSGHPERLEAVASEGLRLQPDDPRWLVYQARALDGLGQPRQARNAVDRVLARDPGDVTARALGERIDAKLQPWSAQLAHTSDWFDDGREAWKETVGTIGLMTGMGTVLARASYSERFGRSDTQFEVEAYPRFRPGTYAYVNIGGSADRTLYPSGRVGLELYQSLGGGFEASAGWRSLDFGNTTNIYVGSLTKYVGNWMLTGRVYHVPGEVSDSTTYQGQARRYFGSDGTSFLGVGYSHGFQREEIRNLADLASLDSDTYRGELDARVNRRLRAAVSGSTSRQHRAWGPLRQNTFSASLRVIF